MCDFFFIFIFSIFPSHIKENVANQLKLHEKVQFLTSSFSNTSIVVTTSIRKIAKTKVAWYIFSLIWYRSHCSQN
jgi:hypothetical protein